MNNYQRKRIYRMMKAALNWSKDFDFYEDEGDKYKRFIIDLKDGHLFGYSNNAKIMHSKLGLLFRSENECRCLDSELKDIYDQILNSE